MTVSSPGSAPIGAAPQTQQQQQAPGTGGAATTPGAATPETGAATPATTGGAAAPAAAPAFDLGKVLAEHSWIGPAAAVAGVGLLAFLTKGKGIGAIAAKVTGVGLAVTGVGLTAASFGAKGKLAGREEATKEIMPAFESYQAQAQQLVTSMQTEYETTIQQLRQQGGTGGTGGTPTTPTSGTPTTPTTPTDPAANPSLPSDGQGAPVVDVPTGTPGTGSAAALVGATLAMPAGAGAGGQVAAPGNFTIASLMGDAAGYATAEQANAAVQATISTDTMGSSHLRWVVIESGGKFYGAVAQSAETGTAGAPLTPQQGSLVAWNAINHTDDAGWQAYSWSKSAGARSFAIPYGTLTPFVGQGAPIGTVPTTTTPTTTAPTNTAPTTMAPAFSATGELGRTFQLNDSTSADGLLVRGGVLQLQQVAGSATGYSSGEEAAAAARQARAAGGGTEWSRFVTTQGSDGRFYLYSGSIVSRATANLQSAAPLHVFGAGFAEYFDGATSAWTAVRDA
ncbi:MAG: hypothetical protein JWO69_1395 [Thermoleophilia bacterium]|nr:hypothetical protein [Thermoleophilia bacterium]